MSPSALPTLRVEAGARRLALVHLDDARAARSRLKEPTDPEALHDYRVALRRLRSCLRGYRKEFRSTVTRKSFREVRRLARGTNRSRDLEVHLAWLTDRRDAAGEPERPGISWLIERLGEAMGRARDEMLALDEQLFPGIHERLSRQLSESRAPIRLASWRRSTAAVTARRARTASRRLRSRLRRIRGYSSEQEIHRARIAAKHLRYILEPFAGGRPGGDAVIARLKSLQDALGDVHDAQVFVAELHEPLHQAANAGRADVGPGLHGLIASLGARGRQAFATTRREWLRTGADAFFEQVKALTSAIGERESWTTR